MSAPRYAAGRKQYLMIGDSVSGRYWMPVNDSLHNSSDIEPYHAPINCGPTGEGVECIQEWIGTDLDRWDIITYNFGMWNIGADDCNLTKNDSGAYLDPALEQYISDLANITEALLQTRAGRQKHVYFVTTNPTALVPECCSDPREQPGTVGTHSCTKRIAVFNQAAEALLTPMGVGLIDLYSWAVKRCGDPATWGYSCDIIPQPNCSTPCGTCSASQPCHDNKATCVGGQCINCTNCDACQVHPSNQPTADFMSGADYLSIPVTAQVKAAMAELNAMLA
mmetsp:Transcript_10420/g.31358  ORF Transcript_10420/g.31358 Transcript_10420/m.31358 type:complete len:280 (+) Transcript_10420:71-910(+)